MSRSRSFGRYRRMPWLVLMVLALGLAGAPAMAQDQPQVDAAMKKLMGANGMFQRDMYRMAAQEYEEFLKEYPKHEYATTARYALAVCQYRQKQYDKAIGLITEVLKDKKFDKRDEALAVLGHACMTTGKLDEALAAVDEVLAKHPDSSHAEVSALNRAQVLYLKRDYPKALQAANQYIGKYPKAEQVPAAMYIAALSQQTMGKNADAAKTLTDLLNKYKNAPQADDATLLLGQALEAQGKLDDAAKQYQQFIKIAPNDRKGDGHYSLGVVLYRQAKYGEAIKELDTVLGRYGKSRYAPAALMQKGLALLAANKAGDARKVFAEVEKNDKDRKPIAQYWLAQCDIAEKKYADAQKKLAALAAAKPAPANLADVAFSHALCTLAMDQFEPAAQQFADFIKAHGKDSRITEAEYRRAFALHRAGKQAESLDLCRKIKDPGPFKQQVAELVAENLFLLKKYDEADKAFAALVKDAGGKNLSHVLRYGQCAYFQGDYKQTIARLQALATSGKNDEEAVRVAIFLVGDANLQLANHDEAVAALEQYLKLSKGDQDEAKLKLAVARLRSGDVGNAEKELAALGGGSVDSTWVQRALLEYGQLKHTQHDRGKAGEALGKLADSKAPESLRAPAEYLLAWIDWEQGKHDPAIARFAKVTKDFSQHPLAADAMFQRGACMQDAGKFDEAHKQLAEYLKAHGNGKHAAAARYRIAVCLSRQKKFDEAAKAFADIAKNKDEVTDSLLYEWAWAQRGQKKNDEAAKSYQRLLSEFPNSKLASPARHELAELLYIDGKYADAEKLLQQVLADKNAPERTRTVAAYRLAWCYSKLDQHDKAAQAFADFAAKEKDDALVASALYQAGEAYAIIDKHAEAQQAFAKLLEKYPKHDLASIAQLKQGEVLSAAGDYDKAEAVYQAYLKDNPEGKFRYLAQFGIGWSLENRKKPADARNWYAKVVEDHNGPTAARAQFQIGETYFTEKQYDRAARELMKVDIVYAYPQWSARALFEAGRAFEQVGQKDQARRQYSKCARDYKDEPVAALATKALAALKQP